MTITDWSTGYVWQFILSWQYLCYSAPNIHRVRMMFGVSSIVPNTNIDGNDLDDSVK